MMYNIVKATNLLPYLVFFFGVVSLFNACETSTEASSDSTESTDTLTTALDKEELITELSMLMSADTGRVGRDNNTLINYAMDQLYDVELTSTGLLYQIINEGNGEPIAWGDFLTAHYKGSFLNGKAFANTHKNNKPLEFYVGNMIDAWNEGLQLIKVGGKVRLLVPSHLGYGESGLVASNDKIVVPPHQLLIFEIEVVRKK